MSRLLNSYLTVSVNAFDKPLYGNASVTVTSLSAAEVKNTHPVTLKYDPLSGKFKGTGFDNGTYLVRAASDGYAPQERTINLNSGEQEQAFILGKKGMPFYYRGRVQVPFEPLPLYLGIVLRGTVGEGQKEEFIASIADRYRLQRQQTHDNYRRNNLYIFQLPSGVSDEEQRQIQREIRGNEQVALFAPVLRLLDKNATLLTSSLIVRFKDQITRDEIAPIAREYGLFVARPIPYAGNAYQLTTLDPISYRLLDICESLVRSGKVEYAEPDLWHTVEPDSITPTDWLYPEQWDHPLLNLPNAWQVLHDIDANNTFGDPNIVIALFDTGIDAGHPAFAGTLSDGTTKLYQTFDFENMVPNNTAALTGSNGHGTCTAGAVTANTNDPSSVPGVNEGTTGVAGNCKLIGIRFGGAESRFSDAYIWTAGFDPHSTTAGFPVAISPGADIISNSFGSSVGSPISGLMSDTFDYLTAYGRNGKGVLLFFSVGNSLPKVDFVATNLRPWAAYKKNSAIGATSLFTGGTTELATDYSNFGTALEFCALSHDAYIGAGPQHNPPVHYGAWASARRGTGNVPGRPTTTTSLSAMGNIGDGNLTLTSTAGMAAGTQAVMVNNPGAAQAEAKSISNVNSATNISITSNDIDGLPVATSANLFNAHPSGQSVIASTGDYTNCMGGTSYATPVCAGVAALVLTVNPNLSWTSVRQIIRNTCIKVDPANTDVNGRWKDAMGRISTDPAYSGPYFSEWYGFGRVDAEAAVTAARDLGTSSDILVRDNLADSGAVPSSGTFWDSPDIWVRNASPASEGALGLPAGYASAPPHQNPVRGQSNWVYVRLKNIGTAASNNCYVRVYIAHWAGTEFVFPNDFIPTNNPGAPIPTPMTPGTYLIGESMISSLNTGPETIINLQWDAAKIPPDTVTVGTSTVHWHPCLLVQVTPFDPPLPSGNHVWDNHCLGQKNVTIVNMADAGLNDVSVGFVIGNKSNSSRLVELEIDRGKLPSGVRLYLQVLNSRSMDWLVQQQQGSVNNIPVSLEDDGCCELEVLNDTRAELRCCGGAKSIPLSLTRHSIIQLCSHAPATKNGSYSIGTYNGRKVIFPGGEQKVRIPILREQALLIPAIIGCITGENPVVGDYEIVINQYDPGNIISGSYGIRLHF